MSGSNDGGQAFPMSFGFESENYSGMSLRDWFAGQALAGLLASGHFTTPDGKLVFYPALFEPTAPHAAYFLAEKMLKESKIFRRGGEK
jgi:hypothetical protein